MRSTFHSETTPMKELFERTIRHVPTGRIRVPTIVRPSGEHASVVSTAADYLVRCLVRRSASQAGAEIRAGMLPAEALVRRAFDIPRCKPHLRDWCDHVNEAKAIFRDFTDGANVPHGRILKACQSLARLEIMNRTPRAAYDPVQINSVVHAELVAIWESLDAGRMLNPQRLAILHPTIRRAGTVMATSTNLIVDGTLVEVTSRVDAALNRDDLRLLVAKAAQANLSGVTPKGDGPAPVAVDRIALLLARHNHLVEYGIEELFGPEGWEQYLEGFAELSALEREPEMSDAAPMMA